MLIKRASYVGDQASQLNTYVTLKLQNVKSTTVTVKGAEPCWEQDFVFETTSGDTGLVVEVFSKEMLILNHAIGHKYIPLNTIPYGYPNEVTSQWYTLDKELITQNGAVVGSKDPTGHMIMLDCRFELPYDGDLSVNHIVTSLLSSSSSNNAQQSVSAPTTTNTTTISNNSYNNKIIPYHSANNDDDDYDHYYHQNKKYLPLKANKLSYFEEEDPNCDVNSSEFNNYSVPGQKGRMNNIASTTSSVTGQGMYNQYTSNNYMQQNVGVGGATQYQQYNNQYNNQNITTRQDNSYDYSGYYNDGSGYNNDSCYNNQLVPDMNSCYPDDTLADYEQDDDLYYNSRPMKSGTSWSNRRLQSKRSLERQDTLYGDDMYNGIDSTAPYSDVYNNHYQNDDSFDQFDTTNDYISEDRQWDSGGGRHTSYGVRLPEPPTVRGSTSVSEGLYYNSNNRGASLPVTPQKRQTTTGYTASGLPSRVLPQPAAAVTKSPKMLPQIPVNNVNSSSVVNHFTSSTYNYNEDYNYAYEGTEAINDNFYDSYGNSTSRKSRSAALPVLPQGTLPIASSLTPGVTDSTNLYNNISSNFNVYNALTTPTATSLYQKTDYSYDNNLITTSTYLMNDNYNNTSTYGSNITTTQASVHQQPTTHDDHSKIDNFLGKFSLAASALKSTVEKNLPHPTLHSTSIITPVTTTTTIGITSSLSFNTSYGLTSNSIFSSNTGNLTSVPTTTAYNNQNSKLPPIPTITNSIYGMDSNLLSSNATTTTTTSNVNNINSMIMETRSTNENDDSMFSRFNSYESESVPYSTSNDLSMYGHNTYDNGSDMYGAETDLGYDYSSGMNNHNDIIGVTVPVTTTASDLDGFGDSFYNKNQFSSTITTTTHNRLGISDDYNTGTTTTSASIVVPSKTLPPIPDNSSIYDTQNSNLYDYQTSDNGYMNSIITTTTSITTTTTVGTHSYGTHDYDGTLIDTTSSHLNDYLYGDDLYNNQNLPASTTATTTTGLTTNHMTDSAYTSDYYDNCQYDYEYTENEENYLASGDIIEKGKQQANSSNLYANNNNINNNYSSILTSTSTIPTTSLNSASYTTTTPGVTSYQQQQQPVRPTLEQAKQQEPNKTASILGQSKSLFGGLGNMIGVGVTSLISKSAELTKTTGISNSGATPAAAATTPSGFGSAFGISNQFNSTTTTTTTSSTLYASQITTTTTTSLTTTTNPYSYTDTMNTINTSSATTTLDPMINSSDYSNTLYHNTDTMANGMMYDSMHNNMLDSAHPEILEPYREDFEDEFHNHQHPNDMMDGNQLGDEYMNGYYDENQRSLPQQDSFDDLEYDTKTNNKNSRMLQKQETILSEAPEYIEDHELDNHHHSEPPSSTTNKHHLQQQESLLPGEEPEHFQDMYHQDDHNQHKDIHESGIEMIHEEPPPRKDSIDPIPTVLKEKPKPKPTAKERWHWAYNKIIMQLNVSTIVFYFI
uniref:CSON003122 protein n=1 Tax=Culicoides sonorensis TaxID=179676 RepID=A0A336KAX6_CULSO